MYLRKMTDRFRPADSRMSRRAEAGFLNVTGILLILVVGAILFAAFKLLPPYIDNYRLQDYMESVARNATYNRMTESDIRSQIMNEVRELGIPIDENDVRIQRSGATVNISIEYMITVDLLVRQVDLQFAPSAGNRNIMSKP